MKKQRKQWLTMRTRIHFKILFTSIWGERWPERSPLCLSFGTMTISSALDRAGPYFKPCLRFKSWYRCAQGFV